ncbi:MAG TPA: DNA polymerase III subunit gamma/tau [Gemmatimonadaceae bacterium]|nr:DNA polymerase III subunit gamma/tau [Gemmatimonadaceae bacterium]
MYLSLARKYRPKTFADVAVQSHVSNTLRGAIARDRVAHGYLLCGPRGVGKTTLARVLAMALNCERRISGDDAGGADAGEPCGMCASCQRIWSGAASLDVVEIDAASNRGVDDARELRERAMYAPSDEARYKVYIVDEAHMLTREAWNALLKILEEPPPRVVFVFATTEPQKIAQMAAPVLSRLQRFDFRRIGPADVRARLATVLDTEKVKWEGDALALLARAADGSMRDALSLTDQVLSLGDGALTAERVRDALGLVAEDEYLGILDHIAAGRAAEIFPAVARLSDAGVDLSGFLSGLADLLRGELALVLGGEAPELSDRAREALAPVVGRFGAGDLLRMLNAVTELEPRFRKSAQQQILLETLLVRFALMDRTLSLEEVLRGMGDAPPGGEEDDGRASRRSGPPPAPAPGSSSRTSSPRAESPSSSRGRADSAHRASGSSSSRGAADSTRMASNPFPSSDSGSATATASMTAHMLEDGAANGRASAVAVATPESPHDPRPSPDSPPAHDAAHAFAGAARTDVDESAAHEKLSLNRLVERWDEVISAVRSDGRGFLAAALEHALPSAVTARGDITLELDAAGSIYQQPIADSASDVLSAIGTLFTGASRLRTIAPDRPSDPDAFPPRRLTEEGVRAERLAMLRKRDPALDLAVDALDLELLD